jgi:TlyA family rRNA methyltransferase/putative hemolysin
MLRKIRHPDSVEDWDILLREPAESTIRSCVVWCLRVFPIVCPAQEPHPSCGAVARQGHSLSDTTKIPLRRDGCAEALASAAGALKLVFMQTYVSRAGQKLDHAITTFAIDPTGKVCADLGCSTGGFTDCLLQHQATKVYAVDTGYGVLDWKLRKDLRVVVMERVNAMHVQLPELVDIVTIDVAWTRQRNILPAARKILRPDGFVISLIKPHYEAAANLLRKGILDAAEIPGILAAVTEEIQHAGFELIGTVESPVKGSKGNTEVLAWLVSKEKANVER